MQEFNRSLRNYELILLAGIVTIPITNRFYPALDSNLILGSCFAAFLGPVLLHVWFINRQVVPSRVDLVKGIYKSAAITMVVFAAFFFANGALDRFPPVQISSRVMTKTIVTGKGVSYRLVVSPSWRGRDDEHLQVTRAIFLSVQVGDTVTIDVHHGAIGIPWFSNVKAASSARNREQD